MVFQETARANFLNSLYSEFIDDQILIFFEVLEDTNVKWKNKIFNDIYNGTDRKYTLGLHKYLSMFDKLQYFHQNGFIETPELEFIFFEIKMALSNDNYEIITSFIEKYRPSLSKLISVKNKSLLPYEGLKYFKDIEDKITKEIDS